MKDLTPDFMIDKRNVHKDWIERYIDFLINSIDAVQKLGYEAVLLNHEGEKDGLICRQVIAKRQMLNL